MAIVVGLTGGIASGKSTVSNILKDHGVPIIDADLEARLAVEVGEPAYKEIVSYFGQDILLKNQEIDRAKLGAIIFNHEEKRLKLNSIVHPDVRRRMNEKREHAVSAGEKLIVLDIPLLFESKLTHMVDKTLLVFVSEETQLKRLMARNQFTEEEALVRIQSQMPLKDKIKLSDAVIDNNGTIEETKKQLNAILEQWGLDIKI
ncbi:dephospho-CoA kinase [Robertmurraya siralis]|uniref:Dephospho-CoA kinase n=1 Tax=Robertmurraya siralis TaxID=77777 RepID=A0A919WDZ2_9BACI|nr:dephospho-CoA kinase [Robertmurraya siralis]PAE21644.1 dephospho-CoA kinase [Bacillus sp. 7504-2]GIN60180.1 dephospho-CoA kinase [Robertmurraya siralis]